MSYASDALIDALKRENNQLQAENAKLKQELEVVGIAAYLYGRTDLAYENAKLRRMVNALLQCHVEDKDICSKCDCRSPLHGGCMVDVMADELGIEEIK